MTEKEHETAEDRKMTRESGATRTPDAAETVHIEIPSAAAWVLDTLHHAGYDAYIVGGCVRDALLGRVPQDWDITTSASPQQVKSLFRRTVDTGIQHGTVTVLCGSESFEVTTYRIDGAYEDGRHPKEVSFTKSLREDLKRRDFTINAMAYAPEEGLIDLYGGVQDLASHVIRAVGIPAERFQEDALRILRAVRFAAQLNFSIEAQTLTAISDFASRLQMISQERIRVELDKLLCSEHPEQFLTLWHTGITAILFPEFDRMMEMPQNNPWHRLNVGQHTMEVVKAIPANSVLRWTALLHDVGKLETRTTDEQGIDHFYRHGARSAEFARRYLRSLRFDNATVDRVTLLVRWHDVHFDGSAKNVRKIMNRVGPKNFPDLLDVKRADALAKSLFAQQQLLPQYEQVEHLYHDIRTEGQCTTLKGLAVSGKDLIDAGMKPGKELGEMLQKLLDLVLDDPNKNQRDILLAEAQRIRKNTAE